jgi:hypothetical protein
MIRKTLLYIIGIVLAGQFINFIAPSIASANFNPSYIVSDSAFENTSTMTAAQIDGFLNNIGLSCIRAASGFSIPDPHGSVNGSFTFGGNVTAGQAIWDISQHYHVNPQVILTTLQKEQGIVGGIAGCHYDKPNPTDPAQVFACALYGGTGIYRCTQACPFAYGGGCMNIAMSYGCPGNCNVDDELFQQQLSAGTWGLRFFEERAYGLLNGYPGFDNGDQNYSYSGPMTPGYRVRYSGGPNIYYDGTFTTNDGTSVNISNGATASLYAYTPFVSGNQKFQNIFEGYGFGDPSTGFCAGNEPPLPYVVRYYNARTFEHFYSAYSCDQGFLATIGFKMEGSVFNTTDSSFSFAVPIYRYYNPSTGIHMWSSTLEYNPQLAAEATGYELDNSGQPVFYVDSPSDPNAKAVYRFYNPKTYIHFWQTSAGMTVNDLGILSGAGYYLEGTAYYVQ